MFNIFNMRTIFNRNTCVFHSGYMGELETLCSVFVDLIKTWYDVGCHIYLYGQYNGL